MQEERISLELAKILKQKGFDWETDMYYGESKDLVQGGYTDYNVNKSQSVYSAPTLSHVQRWLREVHGIHIAILPKILPSNEIKYYCFKGKLKRDFKDLYNTYEEALEAELQEVLKLIKED